MLVAWEKLPAEIIQKSYNIGVFSASLNRSEDGDLMFIKHMPFKSLQSKLQTIHVQSEEIDPFECDISEEDMSLKNVSHLIIDDYDGIFYVEA